MVGHESFSCWPPDFIVNRFPFVNFYKLIDILERSLAVRSEAGGGAIRNPLEARDERGWDEPSDC